MHWPICGLVEAMEVDTWLLRSLHGVIQSTHERIRQAHLGEESADPEGAKAKQSTLT